MQPPVTIIRHPKERRSKCSVQPLYGSSGFTFHNARETFRYDAGGHILLAVDAPELSPADADPLRPLLLLDSTWRLLPQVIFRSLPAYLETAYPRVSKLAEDPSRGLASIEALYAALRILGFRDDRLLDSYYWRDAFLAQFNEE